MHRRKQLAQFLIGNDSIRTVDQFE